MTMRTDLTEQQLIQVPVPKKTSSYSPVPHKTVISLVNDKIEKAGFKIISRSYRTDATGLKVIGQYVIDVGDPEMGQMIAWRNSYDKSMAVGFAAGAQVFICENGVVSGDIILVRRHTGTVLHEIKEKIDLSIKRMNETFGQLLRDREAMKQVTLSYPKMAELLGRLYLVEEIISPVQLSIIKDELKSSKNFKGDSAWDLYNHITFALKKTYPPRYIERHTQLHGFFKQNVIQA